jgi:hypothetical protein
LKREPRDSGMLPVNPLLERSLHIHTYPRSKKNHNPKIPRRIDWKVAKKMGKKKSDEIVNLKKLWPDC